MNSLNQSTEMTNCGKILIKKTDKKLALINLCEHIWDVNDKLTKSILPIPPKDCSNSFPELNHYLCYTAENYKT